LSAGDGGMPFLEAHLLEQRVVRIWGPLDDSAANQVCAELMALDATGDSAVTLYVSSGGGPFEPALAVIDTMDLLGVPVHVTCLGSAEGTAAGVVAAGAKRAAAPHARFLLRQPDVAGTGPAAQISAWAEHHQAQLDRFVERLAAATGRPAEHVEADLTIGRWLSASDALAYGLVDYVLTPGRQ